MLALIFQCFLGVCLMVNATDVHELTMKGWELSEEAVAAYEEVLKEKPDDIDTRTILLGYYFKVKHRDRALAVNHENHVLWLVENFPEAEVLAVPEGGLNPFLNAKAYKKAKVLWSKHLKGDSKNLVLIKNASQFFMVSDTDKSEELLKRGAELAPKDSAWPLDLGHLFSRKMIGKRGEPRRQAANAALKQFEVAYKLSDKLGRDSILTSIGKVAFAAGQMDQAKKYGAKMLEPGDEKSWNYGNKFYHGHHLLGRIALAAGNVQEAKNRLLEAAQTPGSPQLGSFGPNMTLANELLKAGEKEVVVEYFELCGEFWDMGAERLATWKEEVENGKQPDFGSNLNY